MDITTDELRLKYVKDEFNDIVAHLITRMATEKVNLQLELQGVIAERDALKEQIEAYRAQEEAQKPPKESEDPPVEG